LWVLNLFPFNLLFCCHFNSTTRRTVATPNNFWAITNVQNNIFQSYIKRLLTKREVCTENIRPRSRQYGPSAARSVQKRPRSDIFRTDRASEVNNSFIIWLFRFRLLPTLFPVGSLMRAVYGLSLCKSFRIQTPRARIFDNV